MTMDAITKKWITRADYDLETAKAMLDAGRYLYVAFLCQQCIEKTLKAAAIEIGGEALRTHNLVRLAETAKLPALLSEENRIFLADLTPFAIEARYGDYVRSLSEIINKKKAVNCLNKTRELFQWLKKNIKK